MNQILSVIDFSYKNYSLTQVPSEIIDFSKFYKELNCKNVLEIGSLYGGTFYVLCKLSKLAGKKISIDYPAYDNQEESMRQRKTQEKMKTFADDVHIIQGDSHNLSTIEALKNILNGEELDFIFIDGDHTYEGVKKDFEMYIPFLKDGGYVAFHDINDTEFHRGLNCHVAKFWNELKDYKKIEFNSHSMYMGIGVVQVYKHRKKLNIDVTFESPGKLNFTNLDFSELDIIVSIRDRDTKIPIYYIDLPFSNINNGFFVVPQMNYDFMADKDFSGFLLEFYDKNKNFIDSKDLKIKERSSSVPIVTRNYGPFDCLFISFRQLFYDKIYDNFDLDEVKTVVDLGANVGLFSNYMSWKKEVRRIYAVEPASGAFEELKKQFYYYNSVLPHKIGIHHFNGKAKIYLDKTQSILSTFLNDTIDTNSFEEVDVKTLPEFMNSVNLSHVDLIKMDIEGLEYEVFNSMSDKDIQRADRWIVEYHANENKNAEILQNRLKSLGYTIQNFPDKVPQYINDGTAIQGFFFAKK